MDTEVMAAVAVAVSEVLTNVVVHHGHSDPTAEVMVTAAADGDEFIVRVHGSGLVMARVDQPEIGLGMAIATALARSLSVERPDDRTTVVSMAFERTPVAASAGEPTPR